MTASTATATATAVDVVRALFGAFASGDLAALSDLLHADATWHHHNHDRLGGIHRGADAITAYWKFRDGKVCYVRSSEDTAQVTAALTP